MSVGLIVNPKAGKDSGHGRKLAKLLAGQDAVEVKILERFETLPEMMDDFATRQIEILFISSGDGTVQAIQTEIAERCKFARHPMLCLLPHGTTNMTAADLGFAIKNLQRQADFIISAGAGTTPKDVRTRPTVKVVNPADAMVRHGMFLGTGAAWQGTRFCQTDVHDKGLKGSWATFATLATALVKAAFVPANPNDSSRIDRPYEMAILANDHTIADGGQLMYLATTLQKLILGVKPFWGGADGPMRSTLIPYPPPNVFRWSLPLMRGGEDRRVPDGCVSFCADEVLIETRCPFVIDGEFFDPPENEPLQITTGPEFSYVCG
ncbi:MAG TPA: hypothetical protein ENJ55_02245 [Rhizobiales bacterium]|nr:hypothetical protein [Hyphomicrobiales bacterium]